MSGRAAVAGAALPPEQPNPSVATATTAAVESVERYRIRPGCSGLQFPAVGHDHSDEHADLRPVLSGMDRDGHGISWLERLPVPASVHDIRRGAELNQPVVNRALAVSGLDPNLDVGIG